MKDQKHIQWMRLVEKLKKGETKAFDELVDCFIDSLIWKARLLLGNYADVEDVVQEAFIRAFNSISTYKGPNLGAWINTITHNLCIDKIRKEKRNRKLSEELRSSFSLETDDVSSDKELEILDLLSPQDRYLVHLKLIEGLSYKEIASITSLAEGTLRNRVSKAVQKLRKELQKIEM